MSHVYFGAKCLGKVIEIEVYDSYDPSIHINGLDHPDVFEWIDLYSCTAVNINISGTDVTLTFACNFRVDQCNYERQWIFPCVCTINNASVSIHRVGTAELAAEHSIFYNKECVVFTLDTPDAFVKLVTKCLLVASFPREGAC